jgi:Dolichyl-phosphate-mannose-protein mannosyltransferase
MLTATRARPTETRRIHPRLGSCLTPALMPGRVLVLVLIGAALLRLVFFSGLVLYDDIFYVRRAYELSTGRMEPPMTHWQARIGLVGPTALVYRAFGVGPGTTAAVPLACSLLGVLAAFLLGARLFGVQTGLLAAFLLAIFPMDVIFASQLYATTPATLLVGSALGLFLLAERSGRPLVYFASGVALGLAALVHEFTLVALVFYPFYVVLVGQPRCRHALVLAGLLLAVSVDPLVHGLMGDPWARLSAIEDITGVRSDGLDVAHSGLNRQWIGEPILRMLSEQELGLFPWLVAPLVVARLFRPSNPTALALALFIASVGAWITYGTVSLGSYAPLPRLPRYLAPLVIPAVLLLAHELTERRGWRTRIAATALLATTSIACVVVDGGRARLTPYTQVGELLAREKPAEVLADPKVRFALDFVEGFSPPYALSEIDQLARPWPDHALVVTGGDRRTSVPAIAGLELVARVPRPDTAYVKLLRTPLAEVVLRATRDDYRLRDLHAKAEAWSLDVYRLP